MAPPAQKEFLKMSILGFAQFEVQFGDHAGNHATIARLVARAHGADLLVLPELATPGYEFRAREELAELAEPFDGGPTARLLQELARDHRVTLVCGYAERAQEGCYNACLLARPDGALFNYRKIHLFDRERELFLPGEAPAPVIETAAGRVGLMVCFDWFFPEMARSLALQGAQILAHPSNLVLPWCQRAMFCRSVENRVFSITANRTGTEVRTGRSLTFTGSSQILGPDGATLAQAPETGEQVQCVEVDIAEADNKNVTPRSNLFEARRPALYPGLLRAPGQDGSDGSD